MSVVAYPTPRLTPLPRWASSPRPTTVQIPPGRYLPNSPPKYQAIAAPAVTGTPNRRRQRHQSSPRPVIATTLAANAVINQPAFACSTLVRTSGQARLIARTQNATAIAATRTPITRYSRRPVARRAGTPVGAGSAPSTVREPSRDHYCPGQLL